MDLERSVRASATGLPVRERYEDAIAAFIMIAEQTPDAARARAWQEALGRAMAR